MTEAVLKVLAAASVVGISLLLVGGGCGGGGSLEDTCESINWQGRQCQALKGVEWAEENGLPPQSVDGYYSLPENER